MQVWNRGRTISHRVCRYNHMHFSGNWPRLPIITSLGRDNVKAIEKPKKKVWLSVTDCPTSEQGIAEKKEKNNPWTTSFPFFSGLLLQRLITQSDSDSSHTTRPWTPRHHSRQQTSCFMGTSTFRFISQEKRRTGGVRACPLIFTFTRNQHREDVRRSLHCGFSVRWVTSYLCLTAAVAARRRNNTSCFVFQDPLRGSKVNRFPSTVHSACVWDLCRSLSFLSLQGCESCYIINMASVMGIIASDIILTILITVSVFCLVTHHRRQRQWEHNDGEH